MPRRQRYLLGANSKVLSGHLVIVVMSQLNFSTNLSERSSEPVSRLCYPLMLVLPHYNESEGCWVEGQQSYHLVLALNLTISEGCWVEGQHSYHTITKGCFYASSVIDTNQSRCCHASVVLKTITRSQMEPEPFSSNLKEMHNMASELNAKIQSFNISKS